MMDIIVPHSIRKRELAGRISTDALKILQKIKSKPELLGNISAPGLPARTTLYKVYATSPLGPRRLLFLCRHPSVPPVGKSGTPVAPNPQAQPQRLVLIFFRDKSDSVGENMSPKNPAFVDQLKANLVLALDDVTKSTPTDQRYDLI